MPPALFFLAPPPPQPATTSATVASARLHISQCSIWQEIGEEAVSLDTLADRAAEVAGGVTGQGGDKGIVEAFDPITHAFSLALLECQNRRRVLGGSATAGSNASPKMKKSPGASSYQQDGVSLPKGWSSERVPLPVGSGRRNGSSLTLLRFGNVRTLPSKWEDAEKWICSPVSVEAVGVRNSTLPQGHRRPKSKSGPVGSSAGISMSYANSPMVAGFDGKVGSFAASSPFSTGVLMPDRGCRSSNNASGMFGGGGGQSSSTQSEHSVVLSASMHGWSDVVESSCSFPSPHDGKMYQRRDTSTGASPDISRKDVATQMSSGGSSQSSPRDLNDTQPMDPLSHFSKLEVRDVQVDDHVTVTRWSKKHVARGLDKGSTSIIQWKKKMVESRGSAWEVTEIEKAKCLLKLKREEANITAWENLQKAKAEAQIRKLEMKLEKKRSSSMEKILTKLRSAQRKAEEMRSSVTENKAQLASSSSKQTVLFRRASQFAYLSGCFSCQAF